MRVFLTGGSGYIGAAVVTALVQHGHEPFALARSESAATRVTALGATPVPGELGQLDVLREAAASADAAIHLAETGAQADLAAAEAILAGLGDRPYVHSGGVWVYGDTSQFIDESAPQSPPPLVAWRAANERTVLDSGHAVLVLPGVVYGREERLVKLLSEPAEGHYIGDGGNHWAVVHVDDIAQLYVLALSAPAGRSFAGVDNRQSPTMREIAEAVNPRSASITITQAEQEWGPLAAAFALDQRISSARARDELGWRPTAPLLVG